ncbi:MAG TPA: hypothetical protein PKI12_03535 [Bacteroidales bacterium]|nr:hypothetical protein [Bacteroidales bacterium]
MVVCGEFLVASFSNLFVAMRRIKTYSIWQLFYFVAIMCLLLFRDMPFNDFLKIYVVIELVCYLTVAIIMTAIVYGYEKSLKPV